MSLTPIGAVALLFAAYALLCRPTWTYYSAVFFMGFSGCAFANLGGVFGFELSLFFFVCYAMVLAWGLDRGARASYSRDQVAPLCLTVLLGLAILISLCPPALNGQVPPLSISVSVFTGVGLVLTWLTVAFVQSKDRVLTVLRVEFAAVIFISGWGALQLICALLHIPYPSFIFNNSASHSALLYGAELAGGYVRVGSVAVEPSILVQSIAIPCAVAATLLSFGISKLRRLSVATVAAGAFTTLFSTSTTGYFGAAVLLGLLLAERPKRVLVIVPVIILLVVGIAAAIPTLATAIVETSLVKSQSWSFEHRFDSIQNGLTAFIAHPLVGVGAGTEPAKSLPVFLLANLGVVGTAIFGGLVMNLMAGLMAARTRLHRADGKAREDAALWRALCLGLLNAVIVSLAMQSVAGPTYAFPDFWVLIGLMIALRRVIGTADAPRRPTIWLGAIDLPHLHGGRTT